MTIPGSEPFDWAVRVVSTGPAESRAHVRNHTIAVGEQASLRPSDTHPSAIEHLLAALGSDLASGLRKEATRSGVVLDALELTLTGRLDNVLVHLGVVGEIGHPGVATITGTVYLSTDADEPTIAALWAKTLARSPIHHTLARAAAITLRLVITA